MSARLARQLGLIDTVIIGLGSRVTPPTSLGHGDHTATRGSLRRRLRS
jgi:hypothetical protein